MATGPALGCTAAADCLLLADTPDIPVVVYPADANGVIALDNNVDGLVVTIKARTERLADADQIIDTLAVG